MRLNVEHDVHYCAPQGPALDALIVVARSPCALLGDARRACAATALRRQKAPPPRRRSRRRSKLSTRALRSPRDHEAICARTLWLGRRARSGTPPLTPSSQLVRAPDASVSTPVRTGTRAPRINDPCATVNGRSGCRPTGTEDRRDRRQVDQPSTVTRTSGGSRSSRRCPSPCRQPGAASAMEHPGPVAGDGCKGSARPRRRPAPYQDAAATATVPAGRHRGAPPAGSRRPAVSRRRRLKQKGKEPMAGTADRGRRCRRTEGSAKGLAGGADTREASASSGRFNGVEAGANQLDASWWAVSPGPWPRPLARNRVQHGRQVRGPQAG